MAPKYNVGEIVRLKKGGSDVLQRFMIITRVNDGGFFRGVKYDGIFLDLSQSPLTMKKEVGIKESEIEERAYTADMRYVGRPEHMNNAFSYMIHLRLVEAGAASGGASNFGSDNNNAAGNNNNNNYYSHNDFLRLLPRHFVQHRIGAPAGGGGGGAAAALEASLANASTHRGVSEDPQDHYNNNENPQSPSRGGRRRKTKKRKTSRRTRNRK